MDSLIELDWFRVAWAGGLMVLAIGISRWQSLGLEWELAIASGRTLLQLMVVGYVLSIVFAIQQPWAVLGILMVMLSVATIVARNRISKSLSRFPYWLGLTLLLSTAITLGYINMMVIRPERWYDPQYVIPLSGILLGNAMNASAIAGERFVSLVKAHRLNIETSLSLGALPQEAIARDRQDAMRAGMIPIINSMMVVGIVTLPGIITGQLLSGVSPFNASLYQIVIMFMLAFTDLVAILLTLQGLYRQCFNATAQLTMPF
ncbi:MAG: iron export ABC transporter permease subunit FetB [Elainellaceae cyanobacterium]